MNIYSNRLDTITPNLITKQGNNIMNNSNVYTENIADIMSCSRERKEVLAIMQVWDKDGLPDSFYDKGVKFAFNKNSGYVFLVNDDYQCLMIDDNNNLQEWYNSPYDGHEGFYSDLLADYAIDPEAWHTDDIEWLNDIKDNQ